MSIPSVEEAWAAIDRVDRLLKPDDFDAYGNRLPRGTRRQVNKEVALYHHLTEKPPSEDDVVAGWEALEQHALEQGWDDE